MLSLKKGSYLGNLDKAICNEHIVASITSYDNADLYDKMHCHENPHFSFVLNGGSLEKRKNTEIERQPGKITFYHSGEYHQSTCIMSSSRHINLELQPRFLAENEIDETKLASAIEKNPDAKFLLLQVCKELIADDEWSGVSIKMVLHELLNQYLYLQTNRKNRLWLSKIDELLRENLYEAVSLDYLSKSLSLHPVTISKQFHKYYSCTLGEYVRKLRIEKALTLIKNSRYSLTEIAHECGFADQSHFIRTFKQLTGFLPHHYQRL
jgi:AraC family transcriptional regulator